MWKNITPDKRWERIDTYSSLDNDSINKKEFYENHEFTLEEKRRSIVLSNMIATFLIFIGEENLEKFLKSIEGNIKYFSTIGYISVYKDDHGVVDVYYFGKDEREAYFRAAIQYRMSTNIDHYYNNKETFEEDYRQRFPGEEEQFLHSKFYFNELTLKDFRRFYEDNLPEELISYFESELDGYKYDFETDSFKKTDFNIGTK